MGYFNKMISIVIIGKNEAKNLTTLYSSLSKIKIDKELLYVDSASEDDSVVISKNYCDKVIEIKKSQQLCASAGRYLGTLEASYEWILYLDGDMELEDGFIAYLNQEAYKSEEINVCGFIGYYTYIYSDGIKSSNTLIQEKNKLVSHFGGAVLLNKEAVLKAGNWNPSVVANEEIDLYSRLQYLGLKVYGLDMDMVKHIAKKISNLHTLLTLLYPLNQRYFGFGQALKSQYIHKTLLTFIRLHPYPFIFWGLIGVGLIYSSLFILFFLFCIYISFTKKPHYLIIYFTDLFRGISGIASYKEYSPKFEIRYKL